VDVVTAAYVPQVGDRVRTEAWPSNTYITVTAVGEHKLLAQSGDDHHEASYFLDADWVKVTPPPTYPERWANVYPNGIGSHWATRAMADFHDPGERIALIHLATDGTLTLHPVERDQ
jgi:hypothetical protein